MRFYIFNIIPYYIGAFVEKCFSQFHTKTRKKDFQQTFLDFTQTFNRFSPVFQQKLVEKCCYTALSFPQSFQEVF